MMPILSLLAAPQVVLTTTCGATSEGQIGIKINLGFQCTMCLHWSQQPTYGFKYASRVHEILLPIIYWANPW